MKKRSWSLGERPALLGKLSSWGKPRLEVRAMRVACIMMQKNEGDLIHPWIVYHAELFGLSNLFIYDNGSTDVKTLKTLEKYERQGLNVFYDKSEKNTLKRRARL